MGRKQNRTASSAAAAAQLSNAPTFTSFAAATAHALPTYSSSIQLTQDTTPWDDAAIQILKKLSKRDTTTKQRALADLAAHLTSLSDNLSGQTFVAAWEPAFRTALEDDAPSVRSAALSVMPLVVRTFRRLIQPIFPTILPPWVAATGDQSSTVAEAASESLREILPTLLLTKKVATRYTQNLREYAVHAIGSLTPTNFPYNASRALAVLSWLLVAAETSDAIAPILDDPTNPLLRLAKGTRKAPAIVAPQVCELMMNTIPHMSPTNESHTTRAERFAQLSMSVIRLRSLAGWDLALTLLRSGWANAFGHAFGDLPNVVRQAVVAPLPLGLHVLLPLFDALPFDPASAVFATFVLEGIRGALNITDIPKWVHLASVSYTLAALPAFLETVYFVHTTAAHRWLSSDTQQLAKFEQATFSDYILPSCCLFFSGLLPAESRPQLETSVNGGSSTRKSSEGSCKKVVRETSTQVARLLRNIRAETVATAYSTIAEAFVYKLDATNCRERLQRLSLTLENVKDFYRESVLVSCIVEELANTTRHPDSCILSTLASVLSTKAANSMDDMLRNGWSEALVTAVSDFARNALKALGEVGDLKKGSSAGADLGALYSWVFCAIVSLHADEPPLHIITDACVSCSREEKYTSLALITCAHKVRKNLKYVSWAPLRGKEYDGLVSEAVSALRKNEALIGAILLLEAAVDPCGGGMVSTEVLSQVANGVTTSMKSNRKSTVLDRVTTSLLGSPISYSSSECGATLYLLTATSILRAPYSFEVMEALLDQLRCGSIRDVVERTDVMVNILEEVASEFEGDAEAVLFGKGMAKVVSLIGEKSIHDSVSICKRLIPKSSSVFTAEFLKHVAFQFVFGNGKDVPIQTKSFIRTLETVYSEHSVCFAQNIESFLAEVNVHEAAQLIADIADRFLDSGGVFRKRVLQEMLSAHANHSQRDIAIRVVAQRLHRRLPNDLKTTADFERVPGVLIMLGMCWSSDILDGVKDLLDKAVRIVRADASSSAAGVALDMLTASVWCTSKDMEEKKSEPPWLGDLVSHCLRAVRRFFEQARGMPQYTLYAVEEHAASLMSSALTSFELRSVSDDDVRLWTIRCVDALRRFVEETTDDSEIHSRMFARLASMATLSLDLIRAGERAQTSEKTIASIDELSHWASWASVRLLPVIQNNCEPDASELKLQNRTRCSELILKAAERGTLLSESGTIAIKGEYLYKLVPQLSSNSSLVRKAVLTVLTYGAAIDLEQRTSRSFPEKGFRDEKDEISFATNMIPLDLRTALKWPTEEMVPQVNLSEDLRLAELEYFLAWRVFLDLVRPEATKTTSEAPEDTSFRRFGVTYLRANPDVFAAFFSKCIEVVVDGSGKEQAAAGAAAAEALAVEERAAQGIELSQPRGEDGIEGRTSRGENDRDIEGIEATVGHAAGIAFARALQRLPALSRSHVTDRVDRGTSARLERFVRKRVSPLLIAAEIRKVKEWGAFGGGAVAQNSAGDSGEGELNARGSVAGREVWATYTFSDVTLEIGMRLPDIFPLKSVEVEARSRIGMSEARWRKTLLEMTTLLRAKDGTLAEAVELWRRNLDKAFQGAEECPICYSVLHLSTAALPKMQCRACKNLFHSACLCKWSTKSNTSTCPLCRSAF